MALVRNATLDAVFQLGVATKAFTAPERTAQQHSISPFRDYLGKGYVDCVAAKLHAGLP